MAGQARYTALLDACVLYPLAMTDALLSLATAGLFAAKWTTRIEEEWIAALERQRPDLIGRLEVRRHSMREAVGGQDHIHRPVIYPGDSRGPTLLLPIGLARSRSPPPPTMLAPGLRRPL